MAEQDERSERGARADEREQRDGLGRAEGEAATAHTDRTRDEPELAYTGSGR